MVVVDVYFRRWKRKRKKDNIPYPSDWKEEASEPYTGPEHVAKRCVVRDPKIHPKDSFSSSAEPSLTAMVLFVEVRSAGSVSAWMSLYGCRSSSSEWNMDCSHCGRCVQYALKEVGWAIMGGIDIG